MCYGMEQGASKLLTFYIAVAHILLYNYYVEERFL
jgi:hypothetical protein